MSDEPHDGGRLHLYEEIGTDLHFSFGIPRNVPGHLLPFSAPKGFRVWVAELDG